ncbi:MAG TPA: LPXTG cell wall anchor domain-containing protein [Acidimicrobiales bacterium]|nr:LPXTG cell wall anchor domain-containing protein [Acidimicrobiales bacterium]
MGLVTRRWVSLSVTVVIALSGLVALTRVTAISATAPPAPSTAAVSDGTCGPGSLPETTQGRVSAQDVADGRAAQGYSCNMSVISHFGTTGGYRTYRYVDAKGNVCAFFDTTLLFPTNALEGSTHKTGVFVLDMNDPAHPTLSADLQTPAMQSPHESLSLNLQRGLLAADLGNPYAYPGFVDTYDVKSDCLHPVLDSSLPVGVLGHEGTFSPDGNTFWVSSAGGGTLAAVDETNPTLPKLLWVERGLNIHGLRVSDDGKTLYLADLGETNASTTGVQGYSGSVTQAPGLTILDVSQIQDRQSNPTAVLVSHLTWPLVTIPQVPLPVRINGHPYLVEVDEFATTGGQTPVGAPSGHVGAARIIDIADPAHPVVISNIRLAVENQPLRTTTQNDPGANSFLQGYASHYCAVPQEDDPGIVACSFIQSGLRVFDIRDPYHPREIAYFNAPVHPSAEGGPGSNYAMSAPAFDAKTGQIWYTDGNDGFYALQVTNQVWPFTTTASTTGGAAAAAPVSSPSASSPAAATGGAGGALASTGSNPWLATGGTVLLATSLLLAWRRRRIPRRAPLKTEI